MQVEKETTAGSYAGDINEVVEEFERLEVNESLMRMLESLKTLKAGLKRIESRNKKILWMQGATLIIMIINILLLIFR